MSPPTKLIFEKSFLTKLQLVLIKLIHWHKRVYLFVTNFILNDKRKYFIQQIGF